MTTSDKRVERLADGHTIVTPEGALAEARASGQLGRRPGAPKMDKASLAAKRKRLVELERAQATRH